MTDNPKDGDKERIKRELEERLSALTEQIRQNPEQFREKMERGLGGMSDEAAERLGRLQRELEQKMSEVSQTAEKTLERRPLIPGKLIVNAEELDRVSGLFKRHGEALDDVIDTLTSRLEALRGMGGYELFNEELTELILPTLRYLKSGFDAWTAQVAAIADNYRRTSAHLERQQTQLAALQEMQRKLQNREYDLPEDKPNEP